MKIGIIDIEPKIFNTAYMQIARHYRRAGHVVEWWSPIMHRRFDAVFCSSMFDYTDLSDLPGDVICGGTGYDVRSRLSRAMEDSDLDYSIYPKCRKSFLWFSRGCNKRCPWCVVPRKEGRVRPVTVKNLNPRGECVVVCDNSFFGNPEWEEAISCLRSLKLPCDFQGVDVRDMTGRQAFALSRLRHHKQVKFAWDLAGDEKQVLAGIKHLVKYVRPYRLMCYVLIGFNSSEAEDLHRIETLRALKIDPFVMPYDRSDMYQRSLARYVNCKKIFKKVAWQDYCRRVSQQEAAGHGWKT